MTADPLAFLRAALDTAGDLAHAAMWDDGPSAVWTASPPRDRYSRYTITDYCDDGVVVVTPENADDDGVGQFIAANDPAAVLRRIAADRKILALHDMAHECSSTDWVSRDHDSCCWIPEGETCDTIIALAEGWGWTKEAR